MPKRGRLGNDDMAYIRAHAYQESAEEIGLAIDRSAEVVQKFIDDNVAPPKGSTPAEVEDVARITIRQELLNSHAWKNLKHEFDEEELKFFEEAYIKMMAQMRDNVLPTEETQIFHSVKYELLMARNLRERKKFKDSIVALEDMQREFVQGLDGKKTGAQKEYLLDLETQLNMAKRNEQDRTTEYVKLQERHNDILKSLKSTRDQRIKQIENMNKDGYLSVLKDLSKRDEQEKQGRQIELVKLAGKKEYNRLGRPTKYEDGSEDSPILSADTVDLGPEDPGDVEDTNEESDAVEVREQEDNPELHDDDE